MMVCAEYGTPIARANWLNWFRKNAAADSGAMQGAPIAEFNFGSHRSEQFAFGFDVANLGDVFENHFLFGEDGGGHAR